MRLAYSAIVTCEARQGLFGRLCGCYSWLRLMCVYEMLHILYAGIGAANHQGTDSYDCRYPVQKPFAAAKLITGK